MTADLLTEDDLQALRTVLDSDSDRFTDMVAAAGLDPASDLKHMNLARIVVQPGEDLSGYDFTGCNLFGAVMRRVDLTSTNLTGALMDGADLRGATLRRGTLDADQRAGASTGPLPPALRAGPNRLWPEDLASDIEPAIAQAGDDHDRLFNLAQADLDAGRSRLSQHLFQVLLDWVRERLGDSDPLTLTTRHELARAMLDQGKAAAAEADLRALLPDMERVNGKDHPHTLITRWIAAQAALAQGKAPAARGIMPPGPASAAPKDYGRAALLRGWCADLEGDAAAADRDLAEAAAALAPLLPEHYLRRELARYLATRRPGQAGGSTNWMA